MTASITDQARQVRAATILSHGTAKSVLLHIGPETMSRIHVSSPSALKGATGIISPELRKTLGHPLFGFSETGNLDLLVPRRELCHEKTGVKIHSCEVELPKRSFWRLRDSLFMVAPELCFLQMAPLMSLASLVEFGTNLCAKYWIHSISGAILERVPVTAVDKLAAYARASSHMRGASQALRALRWVVGGSASPMETKTSILLGLPKRYGGYGLDSFVMNHRVNPGRHKGLVEQGYFSIDLCWPDLKVGVEYYGEKEHQDVIGDRRRLDALEALGWRVVVIDKQRLYDMRAFEVAALQVAKHLGKRIRRDEKWGCRASALRMELGLVARSPLD